MVEQNISREKYDAKGLLDVACDQVLIWYVLNIKMFEKKDVGEAGKW